MNDGRRVMIIVAVAVIIIGIATASIVMATSISSGRNNSLSEESSDITYLTADIGATAACTGPYGYAPCFGWQRNQAVVFNCVSAGRIVFWMHSTSSEQDKPYVQISDNYMVRPIA